MKNRINDRAIKRWKWEYIALKSFYLQPFARNVYLQRKAIAFSSSMVALAFGLWFYGIYWAYAVLLGIVVYPFVILVGGLIFYSLFDLLSSWEHSRRYEAYKLLLSKPAYCPRCQYSLRTGLAKQCRNCHFDWH